MIYVMDRKSVPSKKLRDPDLHKTRKTTVCIHTAILASISDTRIFFTYFNFLIRIESFERLGTTFSFELYEIKNDPDHKISPGFGSNHPKLFGHHSPGCVDSAVCPVANINHNQNVFHKLVF